MLLYKSKKKVRKANVGLKLDGITSTNEMALWYGGDAGSMGSGMKGFENIQGYIKGDNDKEGINGTPPTNHPSLESAIKTNDWSAVNEMTISTTKKIKAAESSFTPVQKTNNFDKKANDDDLAVGNDATDGSNSLSSEITSSHIFFPKRFSPIFAPSFHFSSCPDACLSLYAGSSSPFIFFLG